MDKYPKPRTIDILLFDGVNLLDVAGPVQAFESARFDGIAIYKHRYVSVGGGPVRAACGMNLLVEAALSASSASDDLLIPGGRGVDALTGSAEALDIIRQWNARHTDSRLISICSGALVLAASGILDGKIATTHWSRLADTENHPAVRWDLDRICTRSGRIYTSAGVTTGIDLALAIIHADCGNAVALAAARELVVQLRRTGGQSQYAMHLAGQFTDDDGLGRLIELVIAAPEREWTLELLADVAGMNARTLSRRFKTYLDTTPARFVERVRVDQARALLSERVPLKRVACASGFGDYQRMRRAFRRQLGVDPATYAETFAQEAETAQSREIDGAAHAQPT